MWKKMNFRIISGSALLAVFFVMGFVLPWFAPDDPRIWNTVPYSLPASSAHWFGTTSVGQDTFWLLTWSIRNSLIIGIVVAIISTIIGVVIGLLAGFRGGFTDRGLTLFMDALIVIPSLPILILLGSLMKGRAPMPMLIGILVIFTWPWPARQARSVALTLRERDFINTARFSGESGLKIITREIFPYITGWTFSNAINAVLAAIATESGLAVLGLSSLNEATLGSMIYWALNYEALLAEHWFWIASPVTAIMLLFIGLFLMSTGLTENSAVKRGR